MFSLDWFRVDYRFGSYLSSNDKDKDSLKWIRLVLLNAYHRQLVLVLAQVNDGKELCTAFDSIKTYVSYTVLFIF